mgnify:CR=1 FL=1
MSTSKLITSDRVYYRIKWDIKIDHRKIEIVYRNYERTKKVTFYDWVPLKEGGDIPWHRVQQILYNGDMLWDRKNRLYNESLFDQNETHSTFDMIGFDSECGKWISTNSFSSSPDTLPETFTVLTFNCLFDVYNDNGEVDSMELRMSKLCDQLAIMNADIVCLQEVTETIRQVIMKHSFIRESYIITNHELGLYGQLFLTRLIPMSRDIVSLKGNQIKRYITITFPFDDEGINNFELCNVHLTSNSQSNSEIKRYSQLKQVVDDIRTDKCLIVGDFNTDDRLGVDRLGIHDAWSQLYPDENGYTYDGQLNGILQELSIRRRGRYDRMLHKGLYPLNTRVVLNNRIDGIWISDHFGVLTTFSTSEPSKKDKIIKFIRDITSEFTNHVMDIKLVGSRVLGVNDTDYDVVVLGNIKRDVFNESFMRSTALLHVKYCEIVDSKVKLIHIIMNDDSEVDVLYSNASLTGDVLDTSIKDMLEFPDVAKELLGEDDFDIFCSHYKFIRNWAKSRQIYGSKYGFLNGISWALLVMNLFLKNKYRETDDFVHDFFKYYSMYNWSVPINIKNKENNTFAPSDKFIKIVNISSDSGIVRTVTHVTWQRILKEIQRGNMVSGNLHNLCVKKSVGVYLTVVIDGDYNSRITKRGIVSAKIWKLPLLTMGVKPSTEWIDKGDRLIYKLGVSPITNLSVIKKYFVGLGCKVMDPVVS